MITLNLRVLYSDLLRTSGACKVVERKIRGKPSRALLGRISTLLYRPGGMNPEQTTFLTPQECNIQVGYIVYPKGHEIRRHIHLPLKREIIGTSEVLIVRKGGCEIDIYNEGRKLVATREVHQGVS